MSRSARPEAESLPLSLRELVALLVALMAVVALGIDMMLPALDDIAADLDVARENDRQYVITTYLFGFGAAQLFYGPLSDRFGRKPVMLGALGLFLLTTLICALTPSFELLLAARFSQGAAAAASRVISVAIARDLTSGRRMAEVMSMVMTAFMAVPVLAPSLGQLILTVAPWRWIFVFLMVFGAALIVWIQIRLPETLHPEFRRPLRVTPIARAFWESLTYRLMTGYTLAGAFFFGGLYAFLNTSQQIFTGHFGLDDNIFPLAFAAIAAGMGVTSYTNSKLVMRIGQRRLSHGALIGFLIVSAIHTALLLAGVDNIVVFIALLVCSMPLLGLIAANFSALAMEPVGHIAGTASALYGFATGMIGAVLGGVIGQLYDGTPVPLLAGQTAMAAFALVFVLVTERGRLFGLGEEEAETAPDA